MAHRVGRSIQSMSHACLALRERLRSLLAPGDPDEDGQGMTEYAVILVLVAVVVIVSVKIVGTRTSTLFSNVSNGLGN
jgi:pilus assembly protein Flp/PilA